MHLRTPTPGQMPVPERSAPAAPASPRELRLDAGATLTGELILIPTHDGLAVFADGTEPAGTASVTAPLLSRSTGPGWRRCPSTCWATASARADVRRSATSSCSRIDWRR